MKNEIDAITDDLLARWHHWRRGYSEGVGYASTSSMFRDTPPGRSMYGRDADAEDQVERAIMAGVDAAVERVPNEPTPWRLCLQFEARNLATGARVWSSARLPTGDALAIVRIEARTQLLRELHRRGLVGT